VPSNVDEDPLEVLVIQEPDEAGRPWNKYPEAIMEHPLQLRNTILQKLCRELHMLAKWMKAWDQMVEKRNWVQLQDRGLHGQCRESNHNKVCESWDPTEKNSRPIFINEERRIAALFYGAIMDWAAQKGRNLDFWLSTNNDRPTMILRAIRAVWEKKSVKWMFNLIMRKIWGTHTISRSHCSPA
jgi:hypothetical protein